MTIMTAFSYSTCTIEDIKKIAFRNSKTIVLQLHLLQITVAIIFKNDANRSS